MNLRLPDALHARLKAAALESRRSLNSEILLRLEDSLGEDDVYLGAMTRGPAISLRTLEKASDCPRAHHHRPGSWCQECGFYAV